MHASAQAVVEPNHTLGTGTLDHGVGCAFPCAFLAPPRLAFMMPACLNIDLRYLTTSKGL